jgi:hypothetical protein
VTSTPRGQHGQSQRTAAASLPPPGGTEHSLLAPRAAHSWARRFHDPQDVTWWVDLVRAGAEHDVARGGRLQAVTLRFQNGISAHSRYLQPIPPDWRECDDSALWRYCERATR